MELLYVYAEQYRVFRQEEFSFSDKYRIHYDPQANVLTIEKNDDYFDFFPGNISGISAIIGKNASGKSSLLSLIGAPRKRDFPLDLDKELWDYQFFMIFLDSEKGELLLECVGPERFCALIKQACPESMPLHWSTINRTELSYWMDSAIISFKQDINIAPQKTGSSIPVKRNRWKAPLQCYNLSDTVHFLRSHMRNSKVNNNTLYCQHCYELQLYVHSYSPPILNKPITRSPTGKRKMPISLSPQFHHILSKKESRMLYQYLSLQVLEPFLDFLKNYTLSCYEDPNECIKYIACELDQIDQRNSDAIEFARQALMFFEHHLQYLPSSHSNFNPEVTNFFKNYPPDKTIDTLCDFFNSLAFPLNNNTSYISIKISQDDAFDYVFRLLDQLNALISDASRFLTFKVARLSDGEQANLAMYSSIYEQITMSPPEKKHFILLFDEIERCMHPEMCRTLISDLIGILRTTYPDKTFQIIISSHSPFIVGDLRKENLIQLEAVPDSEPPRFRVLRPEEQASSFGQNIHTLLKSQFFLDNTFSQYACSLINRVSKLLQCQKSENEHHWLSVEEVRAELIQIFSDQEAPVSKKLPTNEEETIRFLQAFIGEIGEPMLQKALRKQFDRWYLNCGSKQQKIDRLKAQLRELGVTEL